MRSQSGDRAEQAETLSLGAGPLAVVLQRPEPTAVRRQIVHVGTVASLCQTLLRPASAMKMAAEAAYEELAVVQEQCLLPTQGVRQLMKMRLCPYDA